MNCSETLLLCIVLTFTTLYLKKHHKKPQRYIIAEYIVVSVNLKHLQHVMLMKNARMRCKKIAYTCQLFISEYIAFATDIRLYIKLSPIYQ